MRHIPSPIGELCEQLVLALIGVDIEVRLTKQPRQESAQSRLHRRLLDQKLDPLGCHYFRLGFCGVAGAPPRTNGSPTPNRPSSHRCPSDAPAATNSEMPFTLSAVTAWV